MARGSGADKTSMTDQNVGAPALAANAYIPVPKTDRNEEVQGSAAAEEIRRLVGLAQQGDLDAFGSLYTEYHSRIYRLAAFHLGPDAQDAAAETFSRAWKGLPRYQDSGAPFVAWLYGIARHVVADEIKRRRRTQPVEAVPDIGAPDPVRDFDLTQAISKLPRDQRIVIELKYLLGAKNPEVAAIMKKSVGAVNALQWRALRALNETVER